jgi:divalent metal cation (Fe/Co/Zn/Cd) transporter
VTLLNFFYFYCAVGIVVTLALLQMNKNKEKDISEIVQDKIHEMNDDGSFLFHSANFLGHLLGYIFGMVLWPVLIIRKFSS